MDDNRNAAFLPIDGETADRAAQGGGAEFGEMIDSLRGFLDRLAAAKIDRPTILALGAALDGWSERLTAYAVAEADQMFGRREDLPGRGQTMSPPFLIDHCDERSITGVVTFGRYFLGGNGAVHGGAIPLIFDEVLGRLANSAGRPRSRTAYLHTDFRAIAPIDTKLDLHGWLVREQGRKMYLRAELRHGATLCAEAEGLFVTLLPGQP